MKLLILVLLATLAVGIEGAQKRSVCAPRPTERALLRNKRVPDPDCVVDACLSAIQASSQCGCTRMGSEDCVSYFHTTVTPDSVLITVTQSLTTTPFSTDSVTSTATEIVTETETGEVTAETSTTTTTTQAIPPPPLGRKKMRKRGAPEKRIPYYASACSPEAYASACSCVGVEASTSTLSPIESVVATISETVTANETLIETTSAATTVSTTQTTTRTTTVATNTATATATAQGPFILYVSSEFGPDPTISRTFFAMAFPVGNGDTYRLQWAGSTRPDGVRLWLDDEGYLRALLDQVAGTEGMYAVFDAAGGSTQKAPVQLQVWEDQGGSGSQTRLRCDIAAGTNVVTCFDGTSAADSAIDMLLSCDAGVWVGNSTVPLGFYGCNAVTVLAFPAVPDPGPLCRRVDGQGNRAC
ncbi:hypothetical protein GE09DRAFT_1270672 [Coniochaeta sp. 2T2.1]|nr:hypothetical protein GE09DRAFT_1270672 [Coniochaeta sp. 2T2.1]